MAWIPYAYKQTWWEGKKTCFSYVGYISATILTIFEKKVLSQTHNAYYTVVYLWNMFEDENESA